MKSVLFLLAALLLVMSGTGHATPINGSFETGDLTGWQTFGDVSVQTSLFSSGPTEGVYQAVLTHAYVRFLELRPSAYQMTHF